MSQNVSVRCCLRSCRGTGQSCRSSAACLWTSRPPASCEQTQCLPPSVPARPRSAGDMIPPPCTWGGDRQMHGQRLKHSASKTTDLSWCIWDRESGQVGQDDEAAVSHRYLSHTMGRASCCCDRREEQGWRGGGAMGAHPSRGPLLRWEDSGIEEDDDEAEATPVGSGSRQLPELEGGEVSSPTAPCSASPAAACSASRVGEEGGEGRDFFLLEDSSFRRLFFSLYKPTRMMWLDKKKKSLILKLLPPIR